MDISTFDLTSTVTIVLETTGKEITVHKQVLCTHCDFAKACLQGVFQELGTGKILLKQEDDEDSIGALIAWMYHGKPILMSLSSSSTSRDQLNNSEALQTLALKWTKLYIAADKYLMSAFKTEIMTFWTSLCRRSSSSSFVLPALKLLLLRQASSNCALKELLLDRLVRNVRLEQSRGSKSHFMLHPQSPYSKEFFALTFDHPELASVILQRLLQPEIQTEREGETGSRKRRLDGDGDECMGLGLCEVDAGVSIKRRRTSSP